jgi:hypothetical protein
MSAEKPPEQPTTDPADPAGPVTRFPELAEIQSEIEKRIRDNKRFLERFMDEDFADEDDEAGEDDEDFEEL